MQSVSCLYGSAVPYCSDRRTVDYSRQVDFVVLLYDAHGGVQAGAAVADNALSGSPVEGLDVAVDPAAVHSVYSLVVRLLDRCPSSSTWLIVRHAFTIRGAEDIRIVVGDVVALNWV